ncbi:MAG: hypothetical protein KF688_06715 [Pirellulales bacterium]|nr:hypothetical protein [Pirellulales bacterium]
MLAALAAAPSGVPALAAVTTQGDVTPALPANGGSVALVVVGNSTAGLATIDNGTALTGTSATVGSQTGGVGQMTITGFASRWGLSATLAVGSSGTGRINVVAGGRLENGAPTLGTNASGSGQLSVDGFGSLWTSAATTTVGAAGSGTLLLANGAVATGTAAVLGNATTGVGFASISGNQTLWRQSGAITVGAEGRGRVEISGGARIESASGSIANAASSLGSVVVSGFGSAWTNSAGLTVADAGVGELLVQNGGRVTNAATSTVMLANGAAGEAYLEVSGAGSLWRGSGGVTAGRAGRGVVRVLGGGRIESAGVVLGDLATATGDLLVDGLNSVWEVAGSFEVGKLGLAAAAVSAGGTVAVGDNTAGAITIGTQGRLTLAGGRLVASGAAAALTNSGILQGSGVVDCPVVNTPNAEIRTSTGDLLQLVDDLDNKGFVDLRGGTLEVADAIANSGRIALQNAALRVTRLDGATNPLTISSGGRLAATGGTVDIHASVANAAGGTIVVGGESSATFHDPVVNNGVFQVMPGSRALLLHDLSFGAGATTNLVLASPAEGPAGPQIEIGGNATLAGALSVSLASDYQPVAGDAFSLLTVAGSRTGAFTLSTLPALTSGLAWQIDSSPQVLALTVVPIDPADFNGDRLVDGADLAVWQIGFGSGSGQSAGDANGDGLVDGGDFLAWQRAAAGASVAAAASVPEPIGTTSVLIGVGFVRRLRTSVRRTRTAG